MCVFNVEVLNVLFCLPALTRNSWEARRCEQTKTIEQLDDNELGDDDELDTDGDDDDHVADDVADVLPSLSNVVASSTWIARLNSRFDALRASVERRHRQRERPRAALPSNSDRRGWRALLYDIDTVQLPQLSLVASIGEVMVRELVQWLAEWFDEDVECGAAPRTLLREARCLWLFALLARLDTPLHDDTAAAITALLRVVLRAYAVSE